MSQSHLLFAAAGAAVGVAQDRAIGFADRVLSLPTSRTGLVLGRVAADTVVVIAAALAMLAVAALVGFRPQAGVLQLLAAAGLVMLYALAFAALFGALGAAADGPQTAQSFGFWRSRSPSCPAPMSRPRRCPDGWRWLLTISR